MNDLINYYFDENFNIREEHKSALFNLNNDFEPQIENLGPELTCAVDESIPPLGSELFVLKQAVLDKNGTDFSNFNKLSNKMIN